jgi:hypothetical protein
MQFKHRFSITAIAVGTFAVGLANSALFCFNLDPHTAIVGSLCLLFGLGYLMLLGIHA